MLALQPTLTETELSPPGTVRIRGKLHGIPFFGFPGTRSCRSSADARLRGWRPGGSLIRADATEINGSCI